MADKIYDLFLSYDREDVDSVTVLAGLFRDSGVKVWLDRWELVPGQNFADLESVIPASRAIAVCVGKHAIGERVQAELSLALAHRLPCIPILLPVAHQIPTELTEFQAVDLRSDAEAAASLEKLISLFVQRPEHVDTPAAEPAADLAAPAGSNALSRLVTAVIRSVRTTPPAPPSLGPAAASKPPATPPPAAPPAAQQAADPQRDLQAARAILRGQTASVQDIAALAKRLKAEKQFGYARQLLAHARSNPSGIPSAFRLYLGQQHALCTYKDPRLLADRRYDDALRILAEVDDLLSTKNQETLGLAGAICKYKWEAFGQKADLERAANYYLRGYDLGVLNDFGYTGINAAFVLDLLAFQEAEASKAVATPDTVTQRRDKARDIREELVRELAPLANDPSRPQLSQDWWFLATVAEAYFGLGDYANARAWILRAQEQARPADWELESTLRQFASVARLQASAVQRADEDIESSPGWQVLVAIAGADKAAGVRTALIGKVGLALSGGGFRAALYHIGVLARLAELDVLRHVETLSCVSGGSIVGAHYYLEVQRLLETKPDGEITREDYIAIVRHMQRDFLAGVQTDIRTRVFANFWVNLKMAFWPGYSSTEHLGELYEQNIFSRAGDRKRARAMSDLLVHPQGEPEHFTPAVHNWRRRAKVPVLMLNATSLNTGHNWQFTATWMGEPPAGIDSEVDGNYRLRRMYYDEAPEAYRRYPLGQAVAASSCVPGLFEPINLPKLYPNIDVRLVDGGVQDNQGIGALLDEGCTVLLVSDASGQMESQDRPGHGIFSSLSRANSILQARLREAEYEDVAARRRSSLLRGLMFIHLKKGLDVSPVDWLGCEDPAEVAARPLPLTPYGIRKDVQERIAAIRTDLDSFHDVEAYALMTSGYRMAEYEFARASRVFHARRPSPSTGRF